MCMLHDIKLDSESTTVKRLKEDSACTDAGVVIKEKLHRSTTFTIDQESAQIPGFWIHR